MNLNDKSDVARKNITALRIYKTRMQINNNFPNKIRSVFSRWRSYDTIPAMRRAVIPIPTTCYFLKLFKKK